MKTISKFWWVIYNVNPLTRADLRRARGIQGFGIARQSGLWHVPHGVQLPVAPCVWEIGEPVPCDTSPNVLTLGSHWMNEWKPQPKIWVELPAPPGKETQFSSVVIGENRKVWVWRSVWLPKLNLQKIFNSFYFCCSWYANSGLREDDSVLICV